MTNATQDRAIAVVVSILAGAMFLQAGQLPFEAGLFPRLVTAIMVMAAVAMFARSFMELGRGAAEPLFINWPLLAITLVATVLYVIAVGTIGYFTSSAIFVPAIAYALGLRDHRAIVIGTVLFVAFLDSSSSASSGCRCRARCCSSVSSSPCSRTFFTPASPSFSGSRCSRCPWAW